MMTNGTIDYVNDRDAALRLIDWFSLDQIRTASVLVVGAGAIGNEVIKNLAMLGVGSGVRTGPDDKRGIYILDPDHIEMGNLTRSILFRENDFKCPKAAVAARAVQEIQPSAHVYYCQGFIQTDLGEGFVRGMNAVIGCLDSVGARFWLNRRCRRAGKPWIDAGIGQLDGYVSVYSERGVCYECSFTKSVYETLGISRPCNRNVDAALAERHVPTTPTMASLVAAVQVQESLKLLDQDRWTEPRTLSGRRFRFDATTMETEITSLPTEKDECPHNSVIDLNILRSTELSSENTALDLLAKTEDLLGSHSYFELRDVVVLNRKCTCGHEVRIMRPQYRVSLEDLKCPSCGRDSIFQSDLTLVDVVDRGQPPELLALSLFDLGVPRHGIVKAGGTNGMAWLELRDKAWSADPNDALRTVATAT